MMKPQIIKLPKIFDPRGNLSVIEQFKEIPFKILRSFLVYDVPGGEKRGGHAYRESQEFVIAISGSFDVVTEYNGEKEVFQLNRSYYGLYVPAGTWRHFENFSTNSLALVLSSTHFSEEDYIYDYAEFSSKGNDDDFIAGISAGKVESLASEVISLNTMLLDLPRIEFREGNITPLEGNDTVPFDIKRVFYIYDIPGGESRGAHAHKKCHQLIIAASGSFEVLTDNGFEQKVYSLNRPYQALLVPAGVWSHERAFSSGSVCLVLASEYFEESDYIRSYNDYKVYAGTANADNRTDEVKYLDIQKITELRLPQIKEAACRVIDSGWFLLGKETSRFEHNYSEFIGSRFCVAVANGLDALRLILRGYIELGVLRKGDEVIVPANTYIATIISISDNGLVPVLTEPDAYTYQIDAEKIEQALTDKTRAVMIVHLYGRNAYSEMISDICNKHGLLLLEDNAQAAGCKYNGKRTGSFGDAAAHSFYPAKNLGALGDAGAVTTNNKELADVIRKLANYGQSEKYYFDYIGYNSRMDELQAAVLCEKLKNLDEENLRRAEIAFSYLTGIKNPLIQLPYSKDAISDISDGSNVFHIFPVFTEKRELLQKYLEQNGVQTQIHYPLPPHKQLCYSEWNNLNFEITQFIHNRELSLPISPVMPQHQVEKIVSLINSWIC